MFYDELKKRGISYLLTSNGFKKVLPFKTRELFTHLDKIINEDLSVYIDPDCDCDGYFSALIMKEMFDAVGHTKYTIPCHSYKRHDLNLDYIDNLMYQNPNLKYALLLDSSSNSLEIVDKFNDYGVFTIIIDHHSTLIPREEFTKRNCLIINPRIDSLETGKQSLLEDLSAGAIIALIVDAFVRLNHSDVYLLLNSYHWVYGAITVYSDSCKSNLYNIAYLKAVHSTIIGLPPIIEYFMDKYSIFNRSFISFRLVPRINALIRNENFLMVRELFYDFENFKKKYTIEDIEKVYKESKQFVDSLCSSVLIKEYNNIIVAEIKSTESAKARNYTGLVASRITSQYKKVCLVIMEYSNGVYEGSVRDFLSRDILTSFKEVTIADGHPSAFGVSIPINKLEEVILNVNVILSQVRDKNDTILVNWTTETQQEIQEDINLMMQYNEFCLHPYPEAYAVLMVTNSMTINAYAKVTYIKWGTRTIVCPNTIVSKNDIVLIKPMIDKAGYKLMGKVFTKNS